MERSLSRRLSAASRVYRLDTHKESKLAFIPIRVNLSESGAPLMTVDGLKDSFQVSLFDVPGEFAFHLAFQLAQAKVELNKSIPSESDLDLDRIFIDVLKRCTQNEIATAYLHKSFGFTRYVELKELTPRRWEAVQSRSGAWRLDDMGRTLKAAKTGGKVLRFSYRRMVDGVELVSTRRVKVRSYVKTKGDDVLFRAEHRGQVKDFWLSRCTQMFVESHSDRKLAPEAQIRLEVDAAGPCVVLEPASR